MSKMILWRIGQDLDPDMLVRCLEEHGLRLGAASGITRKIGEHLFLDITDPTGAENNGLGDRKNFQKQTEFLIKKKKQLANKRWSDSKLDRWWESMSQKHLEPFIDGGRKWLQILKDSKSILGIMEIEIIIAINSDKVPLPDYIPGPELTLEDLTPHDLINLEMNVAYKFR